MKFGEHPYLLIGNMDLKSKAAKCEFLWDPILEKAEADLISEPILPEDFSGWLWEDLDRTKERILRDCIAYKVTDNDKYFESMKRQLWCLIDEWPWIEKFHHEEVKLEADLRTGIIMFTLGLVYDWMYCDLTPDERTMIRDSITVKGFEMLKKDIANDAFYLTSYGNNWLAVMLGGFAVASLAIHDESDYAKEIVKLAVERTRKMADHVGMDGAWEEGPFYWGGIAFLIMFFDILDSLPGSEWQFLDLKQLKETCMFPLYMNMPGGGRANFSDAHFNQDHNAAHLFSVMARITKKPGFQWAFHQFRNVAEESIPELVAIDIKDHRPMEETYQFLSYDETLEPAYPSDLPHLKLFQGETYGFVSSRSGFGRYDKGLVLCANGGTNGTNHHQLDIGQIVMVYNTYNFISDPGYGRAFYLENGKRVDRQNYFAKSSMGHNIVTIDGLNQIDSPDAHGFIEIMEDGPEKHEFKISMDSAYEKCLKAERTVERSLTKNTVTVTDNFSLVENCPSRLSWFYEGKAEIVDPYTVRIIINNSVCLLKLESTTAFKMSLESYSENGMLDRNSKPMAPVEYPYICITLDESESLHIQSTFEYL
jgi:hypothetical protein